eukprot:TRINITY_DN3178_c0_g1_i1.p1 TRINITY_DN3178_c0_g1~~TRINITY_DN3178_c0_g1_i1.p1  ORF type:complete len:241 (+),score=2.33 TRINITY_DN3178_c0_g1_i1:65-787(+)
MAKLAQLLRRKQGSSNRSSARFSDPTPTVSLDGTAADGSNRTMPCLNYEELVDPPQMDYSPLTFRSAPSRGRLTSSLSSTSVLSSLGPTGSSPTSSTIDSAAGSPRTPATDGLVTLYAGVQICGVSLGIAAADWVVQTESPSSMFRRSSRQVRSCVVVGAVHDGGACAAAGVQPGMLLSVNGRPVGSVSELSSALAALREEGCTVVTLAVQSMPKDEIGFSESTPASPIREVCSLSIPEL